MTHEPGCRSRHHGHIEAPEAALPRAAYRTASRSRGGRIGLTASWTLSIAHYRGTTPARVTAVLRGAAPRRRSATHRSPTTPRQGSGTRRYATASLPPRRATRRFTRALCRPHPHFARTHCSRAAGGHARSLRAPTRPGAAQYGPSGQLSPDGPAPDDSVRQFEPKEQPQPRLQIHQVHRVPRRD
jgi:hypothetical protein